MGFSPVQPVRPRKGLSADALYRLVRNAFERLPDHRHQYATIPLADELSSGFAMFSLKDPSLLAFDRRRSDQNMKTLFGIGQIPSDTQMRDSRSGRARPPAACVQRRLSTIATRQGPCAS